MADNTTTTGISRAELSYRMEHLALSTIFSAQEIIDIQRAASERGLSTSELIKEAVLGDLPR